MLRVPNDYVAIQASARVGSSELDSDVVEEEERLFVPSCRPLLKLILA